METKEINNKHYIDTKVVILPSKEASLIYFKKCNGKLNLFYYYSDKENSDRDNIQNLSMHILSDEKPIEEDWVYDYAHDKIGKFNKLVVDGGDFSDHAKKIIASTEKLESKDWFLSAYECKYVPKFTRQIPKDFFEQFAGAYNSGNKITDALVEVENINSGWQSLANSGRTGSTFVPDKFDVKIYDENFINVIAIKKNNDKWNDIFQEYLKENPTFDNAKVSFLSYLEDNFNPPIKK